MKRYISVVFTLTVFLLAGSPSYGDDTADFFAVMAPPNIVFILDNSSAMFTLPCNDSYSFGNQDCTAEELQSVSYSSSTTYGDWDPDDKELYINNEDGTAKLSPAEDNYALGSVYYQGDYQSRWRKMAESHADFCTTVSTTQDCPGILGEKGYYKKSSGGNQGYYFTGNFLRLYPPKFVAARKVIKDVVMDAKEIRMAVVVFEDGTDLEGGYIFDDLNPACSKFPVDPADPPDWTANRGAIVNKLRDSSLTFDDGPATEYHYAPLAETLLNVGQYYATKDHFETEFGSDYVKDEFDSPYSNNQDTVCFGCQKSFVIIITGGVPTKDQNIPDEIGDYDEDSNELAQPAQCSSQPTKCCQELLDPDSGPNTTNRFWGSYQECIAQEGSGYLDDVAKYLYNNDLRPDKDCCKTSNCDEIENRSCGGKQRVVTYVVGFGNDHPLLQETADNGDGLYLTADNADELAEKLREAIDDILRRAVSFTTPAVPSARVTDVKETTGLTSDDKIYLASFMPTKKGPYEGHLRAYYLDCEGNIVGGKDCNPEADDCKDDCELVVTTTVTDDGGNVTRVDYTSKCPNCHLATDKYGKTVNDEGKLYNPQAPPIWDAGEVLAETPADNRKIYTFVGVDTDGDGNLQSDEGNRIEFTTANAGVLYPLLAYGTTVADAVKLIEYVRGKDTFDEDEDGNVDEERSWKLGDIFHSSPVLVGQPNPMACYYGFTCDCKTNPVTRLVTCYESPMGDNGGFMDSYEIMLRPKMLIAGANDGVLHCFNVGNATKNASGESDDPDTCWREDFRDFKSQEKRVKFDNGTGEEMWAFIPPNLLPKLKDMINSHQYYVDGTPVVADEYLGVETFAAKLKRNWRTVVICGEREGGRHYFALDITYPENNDPDDNSYECPKFLWEFTDPRMGFAWSEALHGGEYGRIGELDVTEKWVTMMGGGLSPRDPETDADLEPNTGNAFFVVDIATGDKIWEYSYDPTSTDDNQYMTYDIPSTPTPVDYNFVDRSSDYLFDWVYIGDLGGQMWKMDIRGGNTANWSGEKFFQADTNISDQLIYFRPSTLIGRAGNLWNLWVYFGTGDRNNPKGLKDSQARDISNRFYGIMDFGEDSSGNRIQPSLPFHEANLTDVTDPAVTPVNYPTESDGQGWYIRLADQQEYDGENHEGEKVLAKSTALAGTVYFTTFTPPGEIDDICAPGIGGAARFYAARYESGAATGVFEGGGRYIDTGTGIPSPVVITAKVVGGNVEFTALLSTSSGQVIQVPGVGGGKLLNIFSWEEVFSD